MKYIKTKKWSYKDTAKRLKGKLGENISNHISGKWYKYKIYEELLKTNSKELTYLVYIEHKFKLQNSPKKLGT